MTGAPEPVSDSPGDDAAPDGDGAPAWMDKLEARFVALEEKLGGRLSTLGKDLGRIRERIPRQHQPPASTAEAATAPAAEPSPPQPTANDADLHRQILSMATREAGLTDDQKQWVEDNTAGMDLQTRDQVLSAYLAGAAATAGPQRQPKTVNAGRAATAATRSSAAHPSNALEYMRLISRAREGSASAQSTLDKIHADPSFTAQF